MLKWKLFLKNRVLRGALRGLRAGTSERFTHGGLCWVLLGGGLYFAVEIAAFGVDGDVGGEVLEF